MRFLIVVEKAKKGYSAYSPDLPGCVATGPTRPRAVSRMQAAIRFHLEGMRAEGKRVPSPSSFSTYGGVPA
jgi:predicted RNase H-like HicB family nuclease